jgi:predicted AlkP superfamily phosphohydrolase/phosphomutase
VFEVKIQLAIIGIDSLDPHIVLNYRGVLPNLSKLIDESPTFIARSVWPVDTIPAWVSVYTGLRPSSHGLLYVYDVFDQSLSDLAKLDVTPIKGRTFWDYAGQEGYRSVIIAPTLMYPAWELNGIMVSKSPLESRVDWLTTTRAVSVCPQSIQEKYAIPKELQDFWGGFPGIKHLKEWAANGKTALEAEKDLALRLFQGEEWNLFFAYFSSLDLIQHRLWRFFDENDPTYPGRNSCAEIIMDYYKMFDSIVGEFRQTCPGATLIVMSDHGHHMRPAKTININEYLRRQGYLVPQGLNTSLKNRLRRIALETANKLDIEHTLIKVLARSKKITRLSKSVYSSSGSIDRERSIAFLSNFAGIKSYAHGGIEINSELVSNTERSRIATELKGLLLELRTPQGDKAVVCFKQRDELRQGVHRDEIYPDLLFELKSDFGVGWELHSDLFGIAYDHRVASGGHFKDAVFLVSGTGKEIARGDITILDTAPSVLDLLGVNWRRFRFDGHSIFA